MAGEQLDWERSTNVESATELGGFDAPVFSEDGKLYAVSAIAPVGEEWPEEARIIEFSEGEVA